MKTNFPVTMTRDEEKAFEALAANTFPNMKKGAKGALIRAWLHKAAQDAGIEIDDKTQYGGSRAK